MTKKKHVNEEWGKEFLQFIETEGIDPPIAVSEKIHKAVDKDLNPLTWKVLCKFGFIQAAVALLTLLICPQFELGLIKHDDAHLRALLGEPGYMALCGAIFLTSGSVLASIMISIEEMRAIKKAEPVYLFLASVFALMIFRYLGTPSVPASYAAWFTGAFAGSAAAFEIIKQLRLAGINNGTAPSM